MKIITVIGQLLLIAFLGLLVWGAFYIYQREKKGDRVPVEVGRIYKTSPLVDYTVVRSLTRVNAALCMLVGLAALFAVFVTSFLATVTGIGVIRRLGRLLILCCAIAGALYVSYNSFSYWRYYSRLRGNGVAETVIIEDLTRQREFNNDHDVWLIFYDYRARVRFKGESRVIGAGSGDYAQLHVGDPMVVLYDAGVDDLMSADFRPLYLEFVFPFVVWGILLYVVFRRKKEL